MEPPAPLTEEDVARLDAEYVPFPSFADWPADVPRAAVWETRRSQLEMVAGSTDESVRKRAFSVVARAAAFDTGAIEGLYDTSRGLTLTVATQAAAWEKQATSHGADTLDYFNAQLATYELVLDVATQRLPVNEAWMRRLHEVLTEPQETYAVQTPVGQQEHPLPRGEYKPYPNHVELQDGTRHSYAPVDRTRDEMARLVDELNSEAFQAAHSILQTAYAHYAFVSIHPFADGNGRVARALSSVYLYRAAGVPFLVFADQRPTYFDALAGADKGRHDAFVAFTSNAAVSAVQLVLDTIRTATAPSALAATERLRTLVTAQGGFTHTEIDDLASGLLTQFGRILQEEVGALPLPIGAQAGASGGSTGPVPIPDGYRVVVNQPWQFVGVSLRSPAPADAMRNTLFHVFVSRDFNDDAEVFLLALDDNQERAAFGLTDVSPSLTSAAEHRLRMFAQRVLGFELTELVSEAQQALVRAGYLT